MDQHDCPFGRPEQHRILLEGEAAVVFSDGFPVAQGHTLIIPKRHVASLFELPDDEQAAVWRLVAQVRAVLLAEFHPDGSSAAALGSPASTAARIRVTSAIPPRIRRWRMGHDRKTTPRPPGRCALRSATPRAESVVGHPA